MQTYTYRTDFGGGVVLAPCDQVFVAEMARCNAIGLLPGLTNLGMPGDLRHQLEGNSSDHNPFVTGPSGLRYVRAFDLGGPRSSWNAVIEFWNAMYARRDPRVYPYGYTNSDQAPPHGLTIWFSNGLTRQGTDGAHGHYSLNRANTNTTGRAAWTPALDSRSPWGLEAFLRGGVTTAPTDSLEDEMTDADKQWLRAEWQQQRLTERADIMEQASKSMRGDVVPAIQALTETVAALSDRVQALRTELATKQS